MTDLVGDGHPLFAQALGRQAAGTQPDDVDVGQEGRDGIGLQLPSQEFLGALKQVRRDVSVGRQRRAASATRSPRRGLTDVHPGPLLVEAPTMARGQQRQHARDGPRQVTPFRW
jgi:hypothetical protein